MLFNWRPERDLITHGMFVIRPNRRSFLDGNTNENFRINSCQLEIFVLSQPLNLKCSGQLLSVGKFHSNELFIIGSFLFACSSCFSEKYSSPLVFWRQNQWKSMWTSSSGERWLCHLLLSVLGARYSPPAMNGTCTEVISQIMADFLFFAVANQQAKSRCGVENILSKIIWPRTDPHTWREEKKNDVKAAISSDFSSLLLLVSKAWASENVLNGALEHLLYFEITMIDVFMK